MIVLSLHDLAAATDGEVVGDPAAVVDAVVIDSRVAETGALFVALRGEHADGHDFTEEAARAGAAVLVERRGAVPAGASGVVVDDTWRAVGVLGGHVRQVVDPAVVAVTGSVGKTTTKDLAAAALAADRATVAAEGSFNNELGVPLTLLATRSDTRVLVAEVGARGVGHIASLMPWVAPDVAVVTAVAGAHLEMFGDLDGVARAKGELVEALPADGTAVLNADDPRVWAMRGRTDAHVVGYGRGADADVRWSDLELDQLARPTATVTTPWGEIRVTVPLPGRHNLDNALAALAVAGALGVPPAVASAGIADATVSRWRGELQQRSDRLVVLNDAYNANPTAVRAALAVLDDLRRAGGRTVAVLGHMAELGPGERQDHEDVGVAAAGADLVVGVGRTHGLVAAAAAGGAEALQVDTPDQAVDALRGRVGRDDVVLVKASRSAGLERVAEALLADDTPRDDGRRPRRRPTPSGATTRLAVPDARTGGPA